MTPQRLRSGVGLLLLLGLLLFGCSPKSESGDSQTNWLRSCQADAQCGGLNCLCGVCTRSCSNASACDGTLEASCVSASEVGAIAQCSGSSPPTPGLCLPRCNVTACANGQMCVAGVCTPQPQPAASVTIDPNTRFQSLVGFGASLAYGEAQLTSHPQSAALYDAIFNGLGLDVLRLRNRYEHTGDDDLTTTGQLLTAATQALGHQPTTFLSSWSPPAALKASGALLCSGNLQSCTLAKTTAGAFNYAGLADYWLASLGAYAKVGVVPDYVGIQNNPNWVPTTAEVGEACKFLPAEGTATVSFAGIDVVASYPGFAEAQAAIVAAFSALPSQPKMLAPETSDFPSVASYMPSLDFARTAALAHQWYGVNPDAVDLTGLAAIGKLESQYNRPIFITEMQTDGFGTALLLHYATVVEGASAYLQTALTGAVSGPGANTQALIGIDATGYNLQDPYYAMRHFAHSTDPGWTRIDAASDASGLLVSAWLSPSEHDLTVILVNAGSVEVSARITLPGVWTSSEVTRSVFSGVERSAALGQLSAQGLVRLPPDAVVTVALSR